MQGVQRFLTNDNNHLRTATVVSAPVKSIEDAIVARPLSRDGSLVAALTGAFTDDAPATFELEVVNNSGSTPLQTTPAFAGLGNGVMSAVGTTGLSPRTIRVELTDLGELVAQATASVSGVVIAVKEPGADGNNFYLKVERDELSFAPQTITLLSAIQAGTKSITGPEFDWDTALIGSDGLIPTSAHRISFGEDENNVYVQYKEFVDGEYVYHFEPAIKQHVSERTTVNFVTGAYTVKLYEDVASVETLRETYEDVVTLYDLLNLIKTESEYLVVLGNVIYDRTTGGQAVLELPLRTDAYYLQNTGFYEVEIADTTPTELIEATCFAATPSDDERAGLGSERWEVRGSVSGLIKADVGTDELIEAANWSGKIKPKLPAGATLPHGKFDVGTITHVSREDTEVTPPICPASLTLGINAQVDTITLTWKARPTVQQQQCPCEDLPAPDLSDSECLGLGNDETEEAEGGPSVPYSADVITRLVDFYAWMDGVVEANSGYATADSQTRPTQDPFVNGPSVALSLLPTNGTPESVVPINALVSEGVVLDFSPEAYQVNNLGPQILLNLFNLAKKYEEIIALIDPVDDTAGLRTDGLTAWDAAVTLITADFAALTDSDVLFGLPSDRYIAKLKTALISAGISPLGKFEATVEEDSGDDCWRDLGDDYYFEVVGDSGAYAPAFVNQPYISAKKRSDGAYYTTKEFGFQINVGTACVSALKEGDQVTLIISGVADRVGHAKGDKVVLGILGATTFAFTGGKDGDNTQTWYVTDSEEGPLAPYALDTETPVAYSDSGVTFLITPGTLDFAKGDAFTFDVEKGQFKWRKNGGSWSADIDVDTVPIALSDGLSVEFTLGMAPSIVVGDAYSFLALQPYAIGNVVVPNYDAWGWGSADPAVAIFDFGSAKDVEALVLAFHDLPDTATVLVEGGLVAGIYTWSEALVWAKNVIGLLLDAAVSTRYLRITVTGAGDKSIGWLYAGLTTSFTFSAQVALRRQYEMDRAANAPAGMFKAAGTGSQITFPEGSLLDADLVKLLAMVDWVKEQDDETFAFFPQYTRTTEVLLGKLDTDSIDINDVYDFQPSAGKTRRLSANLPVKAISFA